jgi:hypothetical protein
MKHLLAICSAALLLTACTAATPLVPQELRGEVSFETAYRVQTTYEEVGTAATISLIDPAENRTVATTLTQPDRSFTFVFKSFTPKKRTYWLEAVKGLAENRAGNDAVRLRTLVRWDGSRWQALTPLRASIEAHTTALAMIAALRHPEVSTDTLFGKLDLTRPEPFDATGTNVQPAEFQQVSDFVERALMLDRDPLDTVSYDGGGYAFRLPAGLAAPLITRVSPTPATIGEAITVEGENFREPATLNVVRLGSLVLPVTAGSSRSMTVTIAQGAASGILKVASPLGEATVSLTVLPPVAGALLPTPIPATPAPSASGGTDLNGDLAP